MGSWKLAAVALTRSRLEESLDYGSMTQRCRLLCRLVCPNCSFQPQLLPPTALLLHLLEADLRKAMDYGSMTQRCRPLCRLVCPNCSFQPQLLPPTALLPLTTVCFFFALHKPRSKVKCAILIELPRSRTAAQGVYTHFFKMSITACFKILYDNISPPGRWCMSCSRPLLQF